MWGEKARRKANGGERTQRGNDRGGQGKSYRKQGDDGSRPKEQLKGEEKRKGPVG